MRDSMRDLWREKMRDLRMYFKCYYHRVIEAVQVLRILLIV